MEHKTEIFESTTHDQQNSLLGDLTFSKPILNTEYVYDLPKSTIIPGNSNETTLMNDHNTDNSSLQTTTTKSSDENLSTKSKPEKTKLFSLKRAKSKSDLDKRRNSTDNGLDVS